MIIDYNYFIINFGELDKNEKLKKKLLFLVFVFLLFHHSFFFIYTYESNRLQSITEGVSALIVFIGILILKYVPSLISVTLILAIYSFFSISIGVWQNGGIFSSEIAWYIITIFSITASLNRKIGILFYASSFIMVLFIGGLQYFKLFDFTKNILANGETYSLFSCISIFVIIGIIINYVFTAENIERIWKKEKEKRIELLEIEKANKIKQDKINIERFTMHLLENREEERKRIALDLHDSISHELLYLKSIIKQDEVIVNTKIDSIINDIRSISRNLHPVMFEQIGLVPNIEQLVERIQSQNNFFISTDITYNSSISTSDELQIYRIIQETLTNITKYSKAHAAKISISDTKNILDIEIKDNGIGFNVKETINNGKAFGLHNIIERSKIIGGKANISSSHGGTIISIKIKKKNENTNR